MKAKNENNINITKRRKMLQVHEESERRKKRKISEKKIVKENGRSKEAACVDT
jgi:hypothetical protein